MNSFRVPGDASRGFLYLAVLIGGLATLSSAQETGPVILLIGPPGSGKTTQAEILKKERGMQIISATDLISRNQQSFAKFKEPHIQGMDPRVDPALNRLVEEALNSADKSKGVILDGYPAAKIHGDHFIALRQKLNLPKVTVIHLRIPDSVVRERLKKQKRPDLEQQIKDYHRELDFAREYFPGIDIREIDGTKKPAAVAGEIRRILEQ